MLLRYAVISDIHANLEALQAVLASIEQKGADKLVVLGDTIGYGPNPRECWEIVCAKADLLLLGNHEIEAMQPGRTMMNSQAQDILAWTIEQVASHPAWQTLFHDCDSVSGYLDKIRQVYDDCLFVHGSPTRPLSQYVIPNKSLVDKIWKNKQNEFLLVLLNGFNQQHCFCGHTHVPALLVAESNSSLLNKWSLNSNLSLFNEFICYAVPKGDCVIEGLNDYRAIINPGSVGQSRDGNSQASYCLYDGSQLEFVRVSYDILKTKEKIMILPWAEEIKKLFCRRLDRG